MNTQGAKRYKIIGLEESNESYPQITKLLPPRPPPPGGTAPGTPRYAELRQGLSFTRLPKKTKRHIDYEGELIYQKGTSVASLRQVIAIVRNN